MNTIIDDDFNNPLPDGDGDGDVTELSLSSDFTENSISLSSNYYSSYPLGGGISSSSSAFIQWDYSFLKDSILIITAHLSESDLVEMFKNIRRLPNLNIESYESLVEEVISAPQVRKFSEESLIELLGFCKSSNIKNSFKELFAKELNQMPALKLLLELES